MSLVLEMDASGRAYKVVLAGDSGVGKTYLMSQCIHNQPPMSTIGMDFGTKTVPLKPSGSATLQLWDTAGQERYRTLASAYFRNAAGAVIVYDITQASTFQNVTHWVEAARNDEAPNVVVILVGNKRDLVEENPAMREVAVETAQTLANSQGMLYHEVSAVSGVGVTEAFQALIDEIHARDEKARN